MGHAVVPLVDVFIYARSLMDILPLGEMGLVARSFCSSCFGVCAWALGFRGFLFSWFEYEYDLR